MTSSLHIEIASGESLSPTMKDAVLALCNQAYAEDLAGLFATFENPTHLLAYHAGVLASHAMWVTRWLQADAHPLMRTAYVEMVATAPAYQKRGFATAIMQRLAAEIREYDLGGLAADAGRPHSDFAAAAYAPVGFERPALG